MMKMPPPSMVLIMTAAVVAAVSEPAMVAMTAHVDRQMTTTRILLVHDAIRDVPLLLVRHVPEDHSEGRSPEGTTKDEPRGVAEEVPYDGTCGGKNVGGGNAAAGCT